MDKISTDPDNKLSDDKASPLAQHPSPQSNLSAKTSATAIVTIDSIANLGRGVGSWAGKVCFVDDGIPGDVIEVDITKDKSRFAAGRIARLLEPSPLRQVARCQFAGSCGGCSWISVPYDTQLEWKAQLVEDALVRIGRLKLPNPVTIEAAPENLGYRNRIQLRMRIASDGSAELGYFKRQSRSFVAIDQCAIAAWSINHLIDWIKKQNWAPSAEERLRLEICQVALSRPSTCTKVDRDVSETSETDQLCLVIRPGRKEQRGLVDLAKLLRLGPKVSQVIIDGMQPSSSERRRRPHPRKRSHFQSKESDSGGTKTNQSVDVQRAGSLELFDLDLGIAFYTYPGQFQQVNALQNRLLKRHILRLQKDIIKAGTILDLYCGNGNLSLPLLGPDITIEGIELDPRAIAAAQRSVAEINLRSGRADYFAMPVDQYFNRHLNHNSANFDLVILDPPRQGVGDLTGKLRRLGTPFIVYVSCDPATLARDLADLCNDGLYSVREISSFDFFPQTWHVETVALLEKTKLAE